MSVINIHHNIEIPVLSMETQWLRTTEDCILQPNHRMVYTYMASSDAIIKTNFLEASSIVYFIHNPGKHTPYLMWEIWHWSMHCYVLQRLWHYSEFLRTLPWCETHIRFTEQTGESDIHLLYWFIYVIIGLHMSLWHIINYKNYIFVVPSSLFCSLAGTFYLIFYHW